MAALSDRAMAYASSALSRAELDALDGLTVIDFGTDWCGHCQAAQPLVNAALAGQALRHLRIEDGPGRPLGRSFRVKLWPTLIFLRAGQEVGRLVRPASAELIRDTLRQFA